MVLYGYGRVIRQRLPAQVCRELKISASMLEALRTGDVDSVAGWKYVPDTVRVSDKAKYVDVVRYMKVFRTGVCMRMLVTDEVEAFTTDNISLCYGLRLDYKLSALRISTYGLREVTVADMSDGIACNTWFDSDGVHTNSRTRAVCSIDTTQVEGLFLYDGTLKVNL